MKSLMRDNFCVVYVSCRDDDDVDLGGAKAETLAASRHSNDAAIDAFMILLCNVVMVAFSVVPTIVHSLALIKYGHSR